MHGKIHGKIHGGISNMYKCIVFDLDGTLADTFEGISHAYRRAFDTLGRPFPGEGFVRRAIGAPLPLAFAQYGGLEEGRIRQAVAAYRQYYAQQGRHQARAYAGTAQALTRLREAGCRLCVATLKNEEFAREMLRELGLLPYFHTVCGMDADDSLTKAALIGRCRERAGAERRETLMVGDSLFDAQGAEEAGVDFLAVTYGFGFRTPESARAAGAAMAAGSPEEAARRILGRTAGASAASPAGL